MPRGNHGKFSVADKKQRKQSKQSVNRACATTVETLETRRLLSTINWTNKGTGAGVNDTDAFNATYGANATLARSIVQRAIDDWERVIPNFNGAAGRNSLDVTVSALNLGGGTSLSTGAIAYDALNKPSSATFNLDDNGGGFGWYFDTAPGTATVPDDSDFINFITPFAAERVDSGLDFYRNAARGVGFALGLAANSTTLSALSTDVGDDPNSTNAADRLLAVDIGTNGSTDYTLTTAGGGRSLFEGGIGYNGPVHEYDLLNNARTLPTSVVRRLLISDTSAKFMRDVYGYTITLPSLINTFYVNLNISSNVVTVRGDMNFNNDNTDVIDLEVVGSSMSFEVNGTDETIDGAQFTSIDVNSGGDADNIDVDQVLSGKSVTINGANGNDDISIAAQFGDIDTDLDSDITVNGGIDQDTLFFNDFADGSGADTYTISSATVTKGGRNINHSLFETIEIEGSDQASVWNVNSAALFDLEITGGTGAETFNVGNQDYDSNVSSDVTINAFLGDDALVIDDANDAGTGDYTLTGTTFRKTSGGQLTFSSMQSLTLNGSNQPTTYDVTLAFAGMPVTINAAQGNDTLDLGGAGNDLDASMASPLTFNGQNGNDILLLDDTGDAVAPDSYTVDTATFGKSSSSQVLTFGTTERMDLTANGGANTINIDAIAAGMNVTLNGGGGDDLFTNTTQNINSTILGNVTLNGAAGSDTVTMNDENDATATEYTLTNNTFQVTGGPLSGLVTYNNDETFNLKGNGFDTDVEVVSTKAGVAYELRGNAGDDDFNFSEDARDLAALLGDVTVLGGPDSDSVNLFDDNNLALTSYYATKTELYRVGTAKVFPTVESLLLSAGDGNSSVHVEGVAATAPLIVAGGEGSNGYFIGNGNWDTNILNQVLVIGGGGSDGMTIDDTLDAGGDNYNISGSVISKPIVPTAQVLYAGLEGITLDANTGGGAIIINSSSSALRINGNAGADTISIIDAIVGQFVEIDGGTGLDNVNVNTDSVGTVQAKLLGTQDLANLRAYPGAAVSTEAGGANLLYTQTLTIDNTGTLDLANNNMIVDYSGFSPRATIQGYVNTARNGGAWTGATGLTSTTAKNVNPKNTTLGVLESNEFKSIYGAAALFDGQAIDNTAVLVKYTYYGDADFNGVVNFDDYSRIDAGFSTGRTGWLNGDFDGNGSVNFDDYSLIDLAFNTQGPPLRPANVFGARGGAKAAT